jgi:hypothetical protein
MLLQSNICMGALQVHHSEFWCIILYADKKASSDIKRVQASSSGSDPCKNKWAFWTATPEYA